LKIEHIEVPDNGHSELPLKSSDGISDYSYIYSSPDGLLDSEGENDLAVKQDANDYNAPERNGDAPLIIFAGNIIASVSRLELMKCQREKEKGAGEGERASLAEKNSDLSFQCGASNDFTHIPPPLTHPTLPLTLPPIHLLAIPPAAEDRIIITKSTVFCKGHNPLFVASSDAKAAFIMHETEADAMERGEVNMATSKPEVTEYDDEYFQSDLANYIPALRGGGDCSPYDFASDCDSRGRAKKDIRKDSGQSPQASHDSEYSIPLLDRDSEPRGKQPTRSNVPLSPHGSVRKGKQPDRSESSSAPSESSRPLRKICSKTPTNFSLPFSKRENVEAVERCTDSDQSPKSRVNATESASKGRSRHGSIDSNISDLQLSPDRDYLKEPGQKGEVHQTNANEFHSRTGQSLHRPGTCSSHLYLYSG
jgi:hypothetical protein